MQQATRYSELNSDDQQSRSGAHEPIFAAGKISGRFCGPKRSYQNGFALIEPHINPEGVHVWSFNASCPIDVLFLTDDARHPMRMNRHEYFEVLYLCSGSAVCHVEDRIFPFEEGDLAVIGSTPCHSIECRTSTPSRLAALFFDPDLIRCDGSSDSVEYLSPFLFQDSEFPHVVPAKTGVPNQVLELMLGIRSELSAFSPRAYLAARTYLKMLLMLLVNQYSSYLRTIEIFQQQQRAVERLRPVFQYVGENCGSRIQVGDAARMCGMSESYFMTFFKQVTGLSFMKYLSQHRIQRSQELLVKTDRSIADISVGVGFCDQSYFGAVFYKLVGITPAAYRRRYQNMRLSDLNGIPTKNNGNPLYVSQCSGYKGTSRVCVSACV
jgi:AraC-like DNA-binding protein/mannose-6-phosphate isomerase-like protein (cupin superfamily)